MLFTKEYTLCTFCNNKEMEPPDIDSDDAKIGNRDSIT